VVRARRAARIDRLADLEGALRSGEEPAHAAPGRQPLRREPVDPDVGASGTHPERDLAEVLEARVRRVRVVGDPGQGDLGRRLAEEREDLLHCVGGEVGEDAPRSARGRRTRRAAARGRPGADRARSRARARRAGRRGPAPRRGAGRGSRCARRRTPTTGAPCPPPRRGSDRPPPAGLRRACPSARPCRREAPAPPRGPVPGAAGPPRPGRWPGRRGSPPDPAAGVPRAAGGREPRRGRRVPAAGDPAGQDAAGGFEQRDLGEHVRVREPDHAEADRAFSAHGRSPSQLRATDAPGVPLRRGRGRRRPAARRGPRRTGGEHRPRAARRPGSRLTRFRSARSALLRSG